MQIIPGKNYRIKNQSQYFIKKYDSTLPIIKIEGEDIEIFGRRWMFVSGNQECTFYGIRKIRERLPDKGRVFCGKINDVMELVNEFEIELAE